MVTFGIGKCPHYKICTFDAVYIWRPMIIRGFLLLSFFGFSVVVWMALIQD